MAHLGANREREGSDAWRAGQDRIPHAERRDRVRLVGLGGDRLGAPAAAGGGRQSAEALPEPGLARGDEHVALLRGAAQAV